MTVITHHPVGYANARGGSAPATFGQRDMWGKLAGLGPTTYMHNILQAVPAPAGLTVAQVHDALRTLVLRHETLRTRFELTADGTLWQHLTTDGEIPCQRWEIAGEDLAEVGPRAERELEHTNFDLVTGPPMRALVGTVHGVPTAVLIVMSHIATDMLSARLVRQDLTDLLAARSKDEADPDLPPRRQPLDQATMEAAIDPATTGRALASWRERLTVAPPALFGVRAEPPVPRQFLRAVLTSDALGMAADALSHRYEMPTTAVVVLAAQAVLLAHYADTDRGAVQVCVGNRIDKELTWATGMLRQHSLAVIDVAGATFEQVVRRTWAAWLRSQRSGGCGPDAVAGLRAEIEAERGVGLDFGAYFNDLRRRTRPRTQPPSATRIRAAAQRSRFAWTHEFPIDYVQFHLRLYDDAGTEMVVFVDTASVPKHRVQELMVGIERLLVWQATEGDGPLTPDVLARVTGIPAFVPPAGWIRVDGSWVDPIACGQLLAAAADGAPTTVRVSEDGRLTGYVSGPFTEEGLHGRCVELLAGPHFRRRNAIAPRQYVVFPSASAR